MSHNNTFNGIFYIKKAPAIRYDEEDGLFFVCYDTGKVRAEFVMRPRVFNEAMAFADAARADWQQGKRGKPSTANVTKLRDKTH